MPNPASSINHSAFEHAPVAAKITSCSPDFRLIFLAGSAQ
jgi:hypothetical protein